MALEGTSAGEAFGPMWAGESMDVRYSLCWTDTGSRGKETFLSPVFSKDVFVEIQLSCNRLHIFRSVQFGKFDICIYP